MDTKIEKMLTALLKSNNQLHWIGGYSWGRTSNDDPFIILYPAAEYLNHKVCLVYPHDFKKLPAFVNTDVPAGLSDRKPDKNKAEPYFETPLFQVVTFLGKETQMGREVRFSDVLTVVEQPGRPQPVTGEPAGPDPDNEQEEIIVAEEPEYQAWPGRWVSLVLYHKYCTHAQHFVETVKYSSIITPTAPLEAIEVAGWFRNYRKFRDEGLEPVQAGRKADIALQNYLDTKAGTQ